MTIRKLGVVTPRDYAEKMSAFYGTPRGEYSSRMMDRLEVENPHLESIIRQNALNCRDQFNPTLTVHEKARREILIIS